VVPLNLVVSILDHPKIPNKPTLLSVGNLEGFFDTNFILYSSRDFIF